MELVLRGQLATAHLPLQTKVYRATGTGDPAEQTGGH